MGASRAWVLVEWKRIRSTYTTVQRQLREVTEILSVRCKHEVHQEMNGYLRCEICGAENHDGSNWMKEDINSIAQIKPSTQ